MVGIEDSEDKNEIKKLGEKISRLVDYYEHKRGRVWEIAALADVLFAINRILKSYNEQFKKFELEDKERR